MEAVTAMDTLIVESQEKAKPDPDQLIRTRNKSIAGVIIFGALFFFVVLFFVFVPRYFVSSILLDLPYYLLIICLLLGTLVSVIYLARATNKRSHKQIAKSDAAVLKAAKAVDKWWHTRVKPTSTTWLWFWIGTWLFIVIVFIVAFIPNTRTGLSQGVDFFDSLFMAIGLLAFFGLLLYVALWVLKFLGRVVKKVPVLYLAGILSGIITPLVGIFGTLFFGLTPSSEVQILTLLLTIVFGGATASIYVLIRDCKHERRWKVIVSVLFFIGFAVTFILCLIALFSQNEFSYDPVKPTLEWSASGKSANQPNPSERGPYSIQRVVYGSVANDINAQRLDYRVADADYQTQPVNGSGLGTFPSDITTYFGFNSDTIPMNGVFWTPGNDAPTPWPVVMFVHGNHHFMRPSELGYEYLGEHLASKGYFAVTIDQNFINAWNVGGDWPFRTWLILEHLQLLQSWYDHDIIHLYNDVSHSLTAPIRNSNSSHPLNGKLDMNAVTIVGHSRGAEANILAYVWKSLQRPLDNAQFELPEYKFNITGLVSIAGSTQYMDYADGWKFENVNLLSLHGSYDAHVFVYEMMNHFQALKFTDPSKYFIKAGVYIGHANHGQFNTEWGDTDVATAPASWFLARNSLLKGEQQRQVAKSYITSFLEIITRKNYAYVPFMKDFREGDLAWLPKTQFVNSFEDSNMTIISNFEEDNDVTTTTMTGGSQVAKEVSHWSEKSMSPRGYLTNFGDHRIIGRVLYLTTIPGRTSTFTITLPANVSLDNYSALVFHATLSSRTVMGVKEWPRFAVRFNQDPVDLVLDPPVPVPHLFKYPISRMSNFFGGTSAQTVPRYYEVPITNAGSQIEFSFTGSEAAEIIIDNIGLI